jgi:hypothetical protein
MSERDRRAILDAAEKLERGQAIADAKLRETEWQDRETLEEFNMMFGENHEKTREYQEAMNRQHLRNLQNDPVLMQELKAQGMTVVEYVSRMNEDPNAFPEIYREGVKKIVGRAKSGPKKARDTFFDPGYAVPPPPANSAAAKKAAAKSNGDDDGVDAILAALLDF